MIKNRFLNFILPLLFVAAVQASETNGNKTADLAPVAPVPVQANQPKPVLDATTPVDRLERGAWRVRHEAKVALARKGGIDLVFLGDSITQFLEDKEFETVWKKYHGQRKTLNLGYSADMTNHALWRINDGELNEGMSPRVIVILIGINNLGLGRMSVEETVKGIKAVVEKARELQPKAKIILLGLLPGYTKATDEVNKDLEAAYKDSSFVLFRNAGLGFVKDGRVGEEFFRETDIQRKSLVHPGARGWEVIFETIEPDLVKLLPPPLPVDNANAQTEIADKQRSVAKKGSGHPEAQWFPKAGLGLFMHWGIHSVAGVQPSWAIFESYGKKPSGEYIALADQFNPQNYDPDKWFAAAAKAGFKYVVLTTKHCDGYALWPSEHGNFSTKQHMNGRDLLKPYVEAARRHGLKVGFYYSPSDWTFNPPGWPYMGFPRLEGLKKHGPLEFTSADPAEVKQHFEALYAHVKGQLTELLTRYGPIDLLWFDGFDWPGNLDDHGVETLAYLRTLQLGIVINDRWYLWPKSRTLGDYQSFEQTPPRERPAGWWEFCNTVKGHWGYSPTHRIRPLSDILMQLAKCRAWGGNYLPNIGPAPDGTLPEDVYKLFDEMAAWMKHSGESVGDVQPAPASISSSAPVTVKDSKTWYFFIPPGNESTTSFEASGTPEPVEAILLRTGEKVPFTYSNGKTTLTITGDKSTLDVVKVKWK